MSSSGFFRLKAEATCDGFSNWGGLVERCGVSGNGNVHSPGVCATARPFGLVRFLHYSGAVEVARSLNGHCMVTPQKPLCSSVLIRGIPASLLALRRFVLAAACAFTALLVPNAARADSLNWQRPHSNDLIVTFVVTDQDPDGDADLVATSTPNDSYRLLIVCAVPEGVRLVRVGETPHPVDGRASHLSYCRRSPRGPPNLLAS